ncbi:hypothetical protein HDV64DRAFT_261279, partial [Trichoderma sp. TUCIM 5745]
MASEAPASDVPATEVSVDDGINPQATSKIKWNVKGGSDRTETRTIGHTYQLEGSPNIQGVEITQSPRVWLYCYQSNDGSGPWALKVPGPTSQVKNDPVRIASYRLELR